MKDFPNILLLYLKMDNLVTNASSSFPKKKISSSCTQVKSFDHQRKRSVDFFKPCKYIHGLPYDPRIILMSKMIVWMSEK